MKEEKFLKNVSAISDLKLRVGYGLTGNQNGIGEYASRGLWAAGNNYLDNPGTTPSQLANPDLRWETTHQLNAGLDLGLAKDRIGIEFNVYSKYTTGLLLSVPLGPTTGFASIYQNAGEMSNKGFELGINTTNFRSKNFKWQTNLNIASNINKIEKLNTSNDASYSTERMQTR